MLTKLTLTEIRLLRMKLATILEWRMISAQVHLIRGIRRKENSAPELAGTWITNQVQLSGHLAV